MGSNLQFAAGQELSGDEALSPPEFNISAGRLNTYTKYLPAIVSDVYPTLDGGELLYIAAYTQFSFNGTLIIPNGSAGELYVAKIDSKGNDEWVSALEINLRSPSDQFVWFMGVGGIITHPTHGILVTGSDYTKDGRSRSGSHISLLAWDGKLKWTIDSSFGQKYVTVDIQDDFVTILGRAGVISGSDWQPQISPSLPTLKSASLLRYDLDGNLIANITFATIRNKDGPWLGLMDDTLVIPISEDEYIIDTRDCWKAIENCLVIDDINDEYQPELIANNTEFVRLRFEKIGDFFVSEFSNTTCQTYLSVMVLSCSDLKFGIHSVELLGRPGYDGQSEFVRREMSELWFNRIGLVWGSDRLTLENVLIGDNSTPFDYLVAISCRAIWAGTNDDCQLGEQFQYYNLRVNHTVVGVINEGHFTPITLYGYPKMWDMGGVFAVFSIEQINSTAYLIHGTQSGTNLSILGEVWVAGPSFPAKSFSFHIDFEPIVYDVDEPVIPIIPDNDSEIPIIVPEPDIPCEKWINESNCALQEPIVEPELEEEADNNLSLTNETSQKKVSEAIPLVVVAGAGILSLAIIISRKRVLIGGSLLGVIGWKARKYTPSVRTSIVDLITFEPGIHQSEICRQLHLSSSQIQHHTEILLEEGSIHRQKSGRMVTYFPICFDAELNEERAVGPKQWPNNLETREKLILLLRDADLIGGVTQRALADKLECSQPNVQKHLKRLSVEGLTQKIEKVWRLTEIGESLAFEIEDEHDISNIFQNGENIF